jgi:aryl-alcohol dehydrogenase-like predicted oxidoreductase
MQYLPMGRTGVRVSQLCLGTMTFGQESDEATSRAIMDTAWEGGINFFDTANIYNKGLTEEIIGRWLPAHRERLVLASKVHFATGDDVNARRSSRRHILLEVEHSLRRLQTDRLDILYLHHWDDETALEDSLRAVDVLVEQGKVLYAGVSNFAAWQSVKALAVARELGLNPLVCIQPMYNLVKRQAEVEILPMAAHEGLAVFPYSPIAAGLLTGKYARGEGGRIDTNAMYKERYQDAHYFQTAERFAAYALERGLTPSALAVAWVASHPAVTAPIIGARNLEQLEQALEAVHIDMTAALREEISALSPTPPLATDREG